MQPERAAEENRDDLHTPVGVKSWVWKYFGFRKNEGQVVRDVAVCKDCRCELRYCGNTWNLSAHLKRRHGIDGDCQEKTQASKPTTSLTTFFPQTLSNT